MRAAFDSRTWIHAPHSLEHQLLRVPLSDVDYVVIDAVAKTGSAVSFVQFFIRRGNPGRVSRSIDIVFIKRMIIEIHPQSPEFPQSERDIFTDIRNNTI